MVEPQMEHLVLELKTLEVLKQVACLLEVLKMVAVLLVAALEVVEYQKGLQEMNVKVGLGLEELGLQMMTWFVEWVVVRLRVLV